MPAPWRDPALNEEEAEEARQKRTRDGRGSSRDERAKGARTLAPAFKDQSAKVPEKFFTSGGRLPYPETVAKGVTAKSRPSSRGAEARVPRGTVQSDGAHTGTGGSSGSSQVIPGTAGRPPL